MLSTLNRNALTATSAVTGTLTAALVLLVCGNVFARYVLATGILWSEELSRLLFVWVVFLGAYIALCRKGHMAVVMVIDALPLRTRRTLVVLGLVLVLGFVVTIGVAGLGLAWTTYGFGRRTPILGLSAAWGYLSVPVACGLMGLRLIEDIARSLNGRDGEMDASEPGSAA